MNLNLQYFCNMTKNLFHTIKQIVACAGLALLAATQNASALDNGVDAYNLRKGDWVYVLSTATNHLGGNVSSVINVATLMSYEASQGMSYIIIKSGEGSTNFPSNANK